MKVEDLNMSRLNEEYEIFLKTNANVGCPMLATALANIICGKVVIGKFDGSPHAWVQKSRKRFDLNNLIEDYGIYLIISSTLDDCGYVRDIGGTVTNFAATLGITPKEFKFWTVRFQNGLEI